LASVSTPSHTLRCDLNPIDPSLRSTLTVSPCAFVVGYLCAVGLREWTPPCTYKCDCSSQNSSPHPPAHHPPSVPVLSDNSLVDYLASGLDMSIERYFPNAPLKDKIYPETTYSS